MLLLCIFGAGNSHAKSVVSLLKVGVTIAARSYSPIEFAFDESPAFDLPIETVEFGLFEYFRENNCFKPLRIFL